MSDAPNPKLDELVAVMARLRAPGGCPWDRDQTHESLIQYLIEETYELVEAIESGDRKAMLEELGDVLYQVLFHADIAAHDPAEPFTLEDVAEQMTAKMVGRHPHVFADTDAQTAADVVTVWEEVKAREKAHRTSVLDGIPQAMPALALADKVIGRASKVGIGVDGSALADRQAPDSEEELGKQLLGMVAAGRVRGFNAETALRSALRELQDQIRAAESPQPVHSSGDRGTVEA